MLAVARRYAPDVVPLVAVVARQLDGGGLPVDPAHDAFDALGGVLVHPLVWLRLAHRRSCDLVESALGILPRAHITPVLLPEVGRQRRHAAVEDIGVLERL